MNVGPMTFVRERFRWGSYGFAGGLIIGLILGWFFHGVISFVVRFGFVALLLVPVVVVFLVWRRLEDRGRANPRSDISSSAVDPVETRGRFVDVRRGAKEE